MYAHRHYNNTFVRNTDLWSYVIHVNIDEIINVIIMNWLITWLISYYNTSTNNPKIGQLDNEISDKNTITNTVT